MVGIKLNKIRWKQARIPLWIVKLNRNRKKTNAAVKWEVATRQTDVFIFEVFLKFLSCFIYTETTSALVIFLLVSSGYYF